MFWRKKEPRMDCPKCGASVPIKRLAEAYENHRSFELLGIGPLVDAVDGATLDGSTMCGCCGSRRKKEKSKPSEYAPHELFSLITGRPLPPPPPRPVRPDIWEGL